MIISVENLREITDINLSHEQLLMKLKALELFIRNYTHNNFQMREIRSQSETENNLILNPPEHISIGDTIQISDSLLNNGIYTVTDISEKGMLVSERLIDCKKNLVTKVYYPDDVVEGVVNLLKWDIYSRDKTGIQSEKLSRHSVSYFNLDSENSVMGYPYSLMGFLKPYMKARF